MPCRVWAIQDAAAAPRQRLIVPDPEAAEGKHSKMSLSGSDIDFQIINFTRMEKGDNTGVYRGLLT
jgi:hypothetical protein